MVSVVKDDWILFGRVFNEMNSLREPHFGASQLFSTNTFKPSCFPVFELPFQSLHSTRLTTPFRRSRWRSAEKRRYAPLLRQWGRSRPSRHQRSRQRLRSDWFVRASGASVVNRTSRGCSGARWHNGPLPVSFASRSKCQNHKRRLHGNAPPRKGRI